MKNNEQNTQHTPGPWKLTRTSYRFEVAIPTEPLSCYAFSLRDEANARLIAAAPELLAALSNLVRCCERDNVGFYPKAKNPLESARAAIAKATGKA